MRYLNTSFRARLIAGAVIWIVVGLGISWFVLMELVRGHTASEFADELDHHTTELVNLAELDPDGKLRIRVPLSDHRFSTPGSGYYWQIERGNGEAIRSPSLGDARLALTLDFSRPRDLRKDNAPGPTGDLLILERVVALGAGPETIRVAVATDAKLIDELMAKFKRTLMVALAVLAGGLAVAAMAQIAYGLRPVGRIRQAVLAVRRGDARRLPDDLPDEVAPLAANVNALLDTNDEMIKRARVQAGNLAHALKTPLALLLDEGRRLEAAGQDGRLVIEQCERMRRQIDYQLARARAAASHNGHSLGTPVASAIAAIVSAVKRLYRDRGLAFEMAEIDPQSMVACEAEDLDEIAGNLIDNAAKWARSRVRVVVAKPDAGFVRICVEDDGPGMPIEARERVFQAGERLDELKPGTGLGLAIVRDMAVAYGGRTWIADSDLGGAAIFVELPAKAPPGSN